MTLAWYFARDDRKLRFEDGRKIVVGKSHLYRGEPELCKRGLHASVRILNALKYAPGPILYRVKLGGTVHVGSNKIAATKRTYLAEIDATEMLRGFARKCALDVIHLWTAPAVVRDYLESGREDIRDAAEDAAWDAAWADADDAARAASRAAARAASGDAARDVARASAEAAAWASAEAAAEADAWTDARDAARDAQNERLARMALSAMGLEESK